MSKNKQSKSNNSDGELKCKICNRNSLDVKFLPCGHIAIYPLRCLTCGKILEAAVGFIKRVLSEL